VAGLTVAFDVACLTQTRAGTARLASGLVEALHARADVELIELGGGELQERGSLGQKRDALKQDLAWYGRKLGREARRSGAEVLHCPTFRGPLRHPGIPTVVTVHDLAVLREPAWFPVWSRNYGRTLMPRAVRAADRVVCVSRATARDVVGLLDVPYRNVRVIPNAIERVFSLPPGPPPLEPPYLLCVGTPEPRKNLPALLEGFAQVRRAGRRVRLALVGADGWGDVRVGAAEGVVTFGRIDDSELRDLYAHSEALVLPSLWEGFGLPVGEALAAGTRVVCSDLPALREIAGEDATYFDPGDPSAIAEGILHALTRPRPTPHRGISWDDVAGSVVALWRELAAAAGAETP
jgi:glycosyltransferase involved in cell wall biosynthesis